MIRDVASVMRGTVLAQGLGFLVLPLLTRLYGPAEFGHFQLYQNAALVVVVFVSLRFEFALLRAQAGSELQNTLALCLISTVAVTLIVTASVTVLFALSPSVEAQLPISPLLVGFAVFLIGVFQFLGFLVTREQMYNISANGKIAQALGYAGIATTLGALRVSAGLIIADALARLCGSAYLFSKLRKDGQLDFREVSLAQIKSVAWKFREFPFITVFGGLINSLGAIVTPVMIYAKFSPEQAGQFALVERSLALPIAMVISAVSQVYMAKFAIMIRENPDRLHKQFRNLLQMLAVVAIIPAVIAFFAAPTLFTFIFGGEWQLAGELAQIMIPAYLILFIYGGVNMTIMLLGRQVLQMAWEALRLACMLVLWGVIVDSSMSVETVVKLHALIVGSISLLFIAIADYSVRKGPTQAAQNDV